MTDSTAKKFINSSWNFQFKHGSLWSVVTTVSFIPADDWRSHHALYNYSVINQPSGWRICSRFES
jgi:hypothetical protein